MAPRKRLGPRAWRGLGLSALGCLAIARWGDFEASEFTALRGAMNGTVVATLLAFYLVPPAIRVVRLRMLLDRPLPSRALAGGVLLHQFFVTVVPLRLGELSLPLLLKSHGLEVARTLASLVAIRILDGAVLSLGLLAAVFCLGSEWPPALSRASWLLGGLGVAVAGGLWGAVALRGWISIRRFAGKASRKGAKAQRGRLRGFEDSRETGWRRWVVERLWAFDESLAGIPWRAHCRAALATGVLWSVLAGLSVLFYGEVAPELPWGRVVALSCLIPLVSCLPLQGVAGIGTTEVIGVAALGLAGVPSARALAIVVFLHAVQVLAVTMLGGLGWWWQTAGAAGQTTNPVATEPRGGGEPSGGR